MLPVLLRIGPATVYAYGVMLAIAFVAATLVLLWFLPRKGVDRTNAVDLVLAGAAGGLIGARILYVASNWAEFSAHPLWIFELWRGGMVFYGGAVLGGLAVLAYAAYRRLPVPVIAEAGAICLALGSAIGRIGCFLNGCCYGVASDSAIACKFPALSVRVLPTQLFDSAADFAIFGILLIVATRPRLRDGIAWWLYLVLYGISRFTVEIFRVNPRGFLGLSQAQELSVLALVVGLAGLAWMWRRGGLTRAASGDAGGEER